MSVYSSGARIAGRYEVAGRPLLGGMGVVYLCYDREEDRPVALKTFKPEYLPDRAARDRFLREGSHWVALGAHPHVVRCYNVLYVDPEAYLVLELVAKGPGREDASLRSWLASGRPLAIETALLFALQTARGMGHAAATIPGFVHRDLKPENLLVGADRLPGKEVNRLRVTDLGLATVLEGVDVQPSGVGEAVADRGGEGLGRTQLTRGVAGTPTYMAPEQWRGEGLSAATDVYALGCVLYEMVAGQPAVGGTSLKALERGHCRGEVRPLPAGVPKAARKVLGRCLALAPGERPGSWAEVEELLAGAYRTVVGRPAPAPLAAGILSREERVAAGWSYNEMGVAYLDIGEGEAALSYLRRAVEAGRREGDQRLEAAGLNHQGSTYARLGDARRAIGYYEQVVALSREVGDRQGEAAALGNLGLAYADLGDGRRAIGYYEQALAITREIEDRRGEGAVLSNLGLLNASLGDPRRAIGHHEAALTIYREIGDRRGEGSALGNLGTAYARLGDTRRAIRYYEQRLFIAREIADRRGEGNVLGNLGLAHAEMGDIRASAYLEQQLAITREIGDRRGEGNALGNLGLAYDNLGDARRAIAYYEQSLRVKGDIGNVAGVARTSLNMAQLYMRQGELDHALPLAEQAANIFAQIGHTQYAQQAQQLVLQIRTGLHSGPWGLA